MKTKEEVALQIGRKVLRERIYATKPGQLAIKLGVALYNSINEAKLEHTSTPKYLALAIQKERGLDPDKLLHDIAAYLEDCAFLQVEKEDS